MRSNFKLLENGLILLKEDKNLSSPIACLNYEYYTSKEELKQKLISQKHNIQCIVGNVATNNLADVNFGETQTPELWDYADNINTLNFIDSTLKNTHYEKA